MLCCVMSCCVVLCCVVLCCVVLCCVVLCCVVLHCVVLCCIVLCCVVLCYAVCLCICHFCDAIPCHPTSHHQGCPAHSACSPHVSGLSQVDLCKNMMTSFAQNGTTVSDPVLINSLLDVSRTLHDSLTDFSIEDDRRQFAQLICCFMTKVSYGYVGTHICRGVQGAAFGWAMPTMSSLGSVITIHVVWPK